MSERATDRLCLLDLRHDWPGRLLKQPTWSVVYHARLGLLLLLQPAQQIAYHLLRLHREPLDQAHRDENTK